MQYSIINAALFCNKIEKLFPDVQEKASSLFME